MANKGAQRERLIRGGCRLCRVKEIVCWETKSEARVRARAGDDNCQGSDTLTRVRHELSSRVNG
jgi:hypothetical protein